MSNKFSLIKADIISILKGFLIALGGASIVFLSGVTNTIDFSQFGQYSQLVMLIATAICSALVNTIRKYVGTTEYTQ